jgi:hypothetical protein
MLVKRLWAADAGNRLHVDLFPLPPGRVCDFIHVKQSDLLTAFASLAIDAYSSQKLRLFCLRYESAHTYGWSVLNISHLELALSDDPIIQ